LRLAVLTIHVFGIGLSFHNDFLDLILQMNLIRIVEQ